jgi:polyisoprenoid-binding protein YceI
MKNIRLSFFAILSLLFSAIAANAQQYAPTDDNSKVEFKVINHFLGKQTVNGSLSGLAGKIVFNPANLSASSFDVTVQVGTIHTGIGKRDQDIKKEKFFNLDKYATIRIRSTRVEKDGKGNYVLHGDLIMKGITKAISIPFTATPTGDGYTFNGSFDLNRSDYGVGDKGGAIEENVVVTLQVHAKKA